jgi:beta-galactosidase
VPHAGTGSRVWREVVSLGAELRRLAPLAGQRVPAQVAFLLDWESWWALELDSHPSSSLRLTDLLAELYRPLLEAGVSADFAHPESDLSGYQLIVVPALYLVTDVGADNVRRFVTGGGTAVITFFSGIVDPRDRVRLGGYPAPWRDLLGLRVEELAPLPDGATIRLEGPAAAAADPAGRLWQDVIELCGASSLLAFGEGHLGGRAAVTRHEHGRGTAFYLGTLPDRTTLRRLIGQACEDAGITQWTGLPPGVEAVRRGDYLFLISHLDHPVEVDLGARHLDLLTGAKVGPLAVLPQRDALVLAWDRPGSGALGSSG